jgi:hypothetical protein
MVSSDSQLHWLARDLCTKLGFCGIGREIHHLRDLPTMDAAVWADEVFRAEGLEADSDRELWNQVRTLIGMWISALPR